MLPWLGQQLLLFGPAFDGPRFHTIGPVSYLEPDAPGAVLHSRLQQGTRGSIILTFGGGVNEMQRDLISQFTLGLPRADR